MRTSPPADQADDGAAAPPKSELAVPRTAALSRVAPAADLLPPNWRGEGAVLCMGGRGPLDDAGATMMAQLVRKHGLGARLVMHEEISRATINTLEIGPIGAICISYAEATGSPAHLRFLLRRLRQRAPGAVMILALWQGDSITQEWDEDMLKTTQGAASTLREVLTRLLDAAASVAVEEAPVSVSA